VTCEHEQFLWSNTEVTSSIIRESDPQSLMTIFIPQAYVCRNTYYTSSWVDRFLYPVLFKLTENMCHPDHLGRPGGGQIWAVAKQSVLTWRSSKHQKGTECTKKIQISISSDVCQNLTSYLYLQNWHLIKREHILLGWFTMSCTHTIEYKYDLIII